MDQYSDGVTQEKSAKKYPLHLELGKINILHKTL